MEGIKPALKAVLMMFSCAITNYKILKVAADSLLRNIGASCPEKTKTVSETSDANMKHL